MQFPVASITTSSVDINLPLSPSSAVRVMSTRPRLRSRPSSHITTSPKVRWRSMPITLLISRLRSIFTGAVGDTTPTDSRSQRNRASRRGGQLLTRALSSSNTSACPHFRAPGASVPDGRTIRRKLLARSQDFSAGNPHTGYQPHRVSQRRNQTQNQRRRHLSQRRRHRQARGSDPARVERRMGRPARPLHDTCMGLSQSSHFSIFLSAAKGRTICKFEGSHWAAHDTVQRPCIRWARSSPNHDAPFASAPGSGAAGPIWKTAWKPRHVTGCRCLGLVSPSGGPIGKRFGSRWPHLQPLRRLAALR